MSTDRKRAQTYFALSTIGKSDCANPANAPDDESLAAYIDGTMAEAETSTIKKHLANCHFCYQRFAELDSALSSITSTNSSAQQHSSLDSSTAPSFIDTIKSHWTAITTGLSSAVAVAFVAFIFVGSPTTDLTSNLRGDLEGMAPHGQWPERGNEITKGVNTNIEVSEETLFYISRGFDDGYEVLAPNQQRTVDETSENCIENSNLDSCNQQQHWAYNVGLWLVLTEAYCLDPTLMDSNSPINLNSLSNRLEDLQSEWDSNLLTEIYARTAQSLCEDNREVISSLGLDF